jgi:hypothetical protein
MLAEELPPRSSSAVSPDDSWVLVGGVTSEVKSKVARGSLDSNNIPSVFLPSSAEADTVPLELRAGFAGSKEGADLILVPKEYGYEARMLLEAVLGEGLIQPEIDNPLI